VSEQWWKKIRKVELQKKDCEDRKRQSIHCVDVDDHQDGPEVFEINKEEESKEEIFAAESARLLRDTNINAGCRKVVLLEHDESTFFAIDDKTFFWMEKRKKTV
jgi:hypothetical protein